MRIWNKEDEIEEVSEIERNGNLTLVRLADGSIDWVAPSEIVER